eukprot:gene1607-1755_t
MDYPYNNTNLGSSSHTTTAKKKKKSSSSSTSTKLVVAVRLRPIITEDLQEANLIRNAPEICVCFKNDGQSIKLIEDQYHSKFFKVDHTFDSSFGQSEVYDILVKPIVKDVLDGYNGTCLVYGQTGSGKTYTMFGSDAKLGMAHFALRDIFHNVTLLENAGLVAKVYLSFYQIYTEQIYDLLSDQNNNNNNSHSNNNGSVSINSSGNYNNNNYNNNSNNNSNSNSYGNSGYSNHHHQKGLPQALMIREDNEHGVYVEGLQSIFVKDIDMAHCIVKQGLHHRKVYSTNYNFRSSRSHAVLTVYLDFEEPSDYQPMTLNDAIGHAEHRYFIRRRKLLLVDLAGSERVPNYRHLPKQHMKEAMLINKSIAALGNVIGALCNQEIRGQEMQQHIPYRDCKLTRLLADSLGGNSKTALICTIGPCAYQLEETKSTLKFASRAKVIRKPVQKLVPKEIVVHPQVLPYLDGNQMEEIYEEEPQAEDNPDEASQYEGQQSWEQQTMQSNVPYYLQTAQGSSVSASNDPSAHQMVYPPFSPAAQSQAMHPGFVPSSCGGMTHGENTESPVSHFMRSYMSPYPNLRLEAEPSHQFTLRDFLRACTIANRAFNDPPPNEQNEEYVKYFTREAENYRAKQQTKSSSPISPEPRAQQPLPSPWTGTRPTLDFNDDEEMANEEKNDDDDDYKNSKNGQLLRSSNSTMEIGIQTAPVLANTSDKVKSPRRYHLDDFNDDESIPKFRDQEQQTDPIMVSITEDELVEEEVRKYQVEVMAQRDHMDLATQLWQLQQQLRKKDEQIKALTELLLDS